MTTSTKHIGRGKNFGERGLEKMGENAVKVFDTFYEYLEEHKWFEVNMPSRKQMACKIIQTIRGKRFVKNNIGVPKK